ncbi:translocon at the outer membrane of chloroplasts 64 [Ditylenchus destructor]|nr:translocon at the outer membrane of chloroplasts 64 [Ditylenchus destructor]
MFHACSWGENILRLSTNSGNEQFNQGNFDAAIGLYTRSLQEEGHSTLTYSNRAFAYLKTGRAQEALDDANAAMALDDGNIKARYRKALALKALGRSNEALKQADSCKEFMAGCDELEKLIHELHDSMNFPNMPKNRKMKRIAELNIGPTMFDPRNPISVKFADGSTRKMHSAHELEQALSSCNYKLSRVNFTGVRFDENFLRILRTVNPTLWTGMFRISNCDFSRISKEEIFGVFRNVLRPECVTFTDNDGLTSEIFNQAIRDSLLECSLAILNDDVDVQLNANDCLEFLHRRKNLNPSSILTVRQEFIEGGIQAFVEKIVERFKSSKKRASFQLNIQADVTLLTERSIYNPDTKEVLVEQKMSVGTFVQTSLIRRRQ